MSDSKYDYWFRRLMRSGYTAAAAHERAESLAKTAKTPVTTTQTRGKP